MVCVEGCTRLTTVLLSAAAIVAAAAAPTASLTVPAVER